MKFCSHCGNQIDEQATFCSACGQAQNTAQTQSANISHRLHCPICKCTQLSPVVETEISGGTSLNHSVTRKSSVSAFNLKNTHRNYWMCQSCGHKFRNIDNLNEEIAGQTKAQKSCIYSAILFAILCLIAYGSTGIVPALVIATLFCGFSIYFKKKINVMVQERDHLMQACFH